MRSPGGDGDRVGLGSRTPSGGECAVRPAARRSSSWTQTSTIIGYALAPGLSTWALAATVNDQLDYFGATTREAVRALEQARAGDLVLTQAVAADPEVAVLLGGRRIATEVVPVELDGQPHIIRARLDSV
jgi:hypothetical protein